MPDISDLLPQNTSPDPNQQSLAEMLGVPPRQSPRVRAIQAELDKSAGEYLQVKQQYEMARIAFEAARERFSGVRRLANEVLTPEDWFDWKFKNESVQLAALPIGEAIMEGFWSHTFDTAYAHVVKHKEFKPQMSLHELCQLLEKGGYDFRTTTPLREINGALMNLNGLVKLETGEYQREDAAEILENVRKKKAG